MFPFFVISIIVLIVVALFFVLFPIIKRQILKNNYIYRYGKDVYRFANIYDYYLINKLTLKSYDDRLVVIDHLLFGNKYLFVIKDCYYNGAIEYKSQDKRWSFYYGNPKKPSRKIISNPILENKTRLAKLSQITGFDSSFLISVVILNNDCEFKEWSSMTNDSFLIKRKNLKKLITDIEKRDVPPLNSEQLNYVVHDLARLNQRP